MQDIANINIDLQDYYTKASDNPAQPVKMSRNAKAEVARNSKTSHYTTKRKLSKDATQTSSKYHSRVS